MSDKLDHIVEPNKMVASPAAMSADTAPAAMPGEIVESAWNAIADQFNQWSELGQDEKDSLTKFAAALFAPILAEKDREIEKLECDVAYYVDGNAVERIKHEGAVKRGLMVLDAKNEWRDRALAAEAALAAERERCAKIAEGSSANFDFQEAQAECRDYDCGYNSGRQLAAAAIRAQGE